MTLYYRRRRRKILFLTVIIILFSILIYSISRMRPVFIMLSESKTQTLTIKTVNEIANRKLSESNEDLIEYQKDDAGGIHAVNVNAAAMNKISNEIATEIATALEQIGDTYIYIPIGSLFGNELFSASGPRIQIQIIPVGDIKAEYGTEFTSTGINQTRHKIYLKILCKMSVLAPFMKNTVDVSLEVPIADTVIVGDVPQSFYKFEGISAGDSMNLID